MIDKRQEGDTQHPIKDAGTAHLAQAQNDLSSASTRTALMDQARAGYTRGGVSDTLDFNNFGNLYGNGAGPLDSTASTTSTATSRDLTTAFNQALSDRGVLPFAAGSDLATPLSGGGAAAVRADSTVATATPDATVGAPAVAGDARPTTTTTAPPPSDAGGVEVKRGDSLWKIARHQLGPHASNSDVMKYVKDMAKENGMPDPFKPENHRATIIHPGQHLKLPAGHSDAPQTTPQTQPHDTPPQTQPLSPHARPEIQQPGQPQPQPEPQPQKQPDVQPETKPPAKPTDLPANPSDNPTPRPEAAPPSSDGQGLDATRTKLQQDIASSSLPDAEKQRMLDNMKAFEARAAAEHLSPDEIQKTYQQADRLLSST
ncbi:MAG TPA: LysM peptidoglycan-binding domain-containing protein, partial [Chroococcales cyanobacterium]